MYCALRLGRVCPSSARWCLSCCREILPMTKPVLPARCDVLVDSPKTGDIGGNNDALVTTHHPSRRGDCAAQTMIPLLLSPVRRWCSHGLLSSLVRHLSVHLSCGDLAVSESSLHQVEITGLPVQPRRERMPQGVDREGPGDACQLRSSCLYHPQRASSPVESMRMTDTGVCPIRRREGR
jgi:hypothetical protein